MEELSRNIFIVCLIISLVSCRSQKSVTMDEEPLKEWSETTEGKILSIRGHNFQTMKVKRMDIDFMLNGQVENVKANMAVYRDSLIVISVIPAFGYEALRIMCTKDSVMIINRPDKTYSADAFDSFINKYKIPMRFNDLQAVLANEAFYYMVGSDNQDLKKNIIPKGEQIQYILEKSKDGEKLTKQLIVVDGRDLNIMNVFIIDFKRKVQLDLMYDDFTDMDMELFPKHIGIELTGGNNKLGMNISYGQVVFNDSINAEFKPPNTYKRVDM